MFDGKIRVNWSLLRVDFPILDNCVPTYFKPLQFYQLSINFPFILHTLVVLGLALLFSFCVILKCSVLFHSVC